MAENNGASAFFGLLAAAGIGFYAGYYYAENLKGESILNHPEKTNETALGENQVARPIDVKANYNGKRWDFGKFNPETDEIKVGDIITYSPGHGAKIEVSASVDNIIFLHSDAYNKGAIGVVYYTSKPYVNHQELRPGNYVCIGVKLGMFMFKEWHSERKSSAGMPISVTRRGICGRFRFIPATRRPPVKPTKS